MKVIRKLQTITFLTILLFVAGIFFVTPSAFAQTPSTQDNFDGTALDSAWTFIGPGSSTYSLTANPGSLQMTVPAGSSHDCWNTTLGCARMLRNVSSGDAVFETSITGQNITSQYQAYGIFLMQDATNYIRVEYWSDGNGPQARAWKVINGVGSYVFATNKPVTLGNENKLRVTESGDTYTVEYNIDGAGWIAAGSFIQAFTVNQAGVHVDNASGNPQTTANFDYFTSTGSEIPTPTQAGSCSVTPTSTNSVTMNISVPETKTYTVWSRMLVPDSANNAFYLQIDGGCAINVGNSSSIPANQFTWVNYRNGSAANKINVPLTAGEHVFKLTERDPGVGIDKLLLADTACVPTDFGTNCEVAQSTLTPTPNPLTATIETSPTNSSVTVGTPFTVDVLVKGGGKMFNAAQATVAVSANLSLTGITAPTTNACNLTYAGETPSVTNPSFAGALLGSSSNQCTVYTMNLTPLSQGTGTITLSNASVKDYEDNSEILLAVNNGAYSINAAAPGEPTSVPATATPEPTVTPTTVPTVEPTAEPTVAPTAAPSGVPAPTVEPISPPTIGSITSPTYSANTLLAGSRPTTVTRIYINNSPDAVTFATNTSWQKTVNLSLGINTIEVIGEDSLGNKTTPKFANIVRHKLSDINGDTAINLTDISLFAFDWLKTSNLGNRLSDMNDDGIVNLTDFSIIAKQYGQ